MRDTMPAVSVVIPSYNRATLLATALRSLVGQTFIDWEAFVVDNHSTDSTDDVVASFADPRIQLLKIRNHGVIAASRNMGIRAARGRYVAFLDADDWWTSTKLAAATDALEQGCDVCHHDMWVVTSEQQRVFRQRVGAHALLRPVYDDLLLRGNAVLNSSVVVRAELLRRIGGLSEDPTLITAEDFDGWLRLAQITERFCFLPEVHGYYWQGGGNASNPKRAVVSLPRLHELHLSGFMERRGGRLPLWFQYGLARAAYMTGDRATARWHLRQLVLRPAPPTILLKSAFMLVRSGFGRGG